MDENTKVMTMKDWLICMLVMCVPLVNIVMMFVWAFDNGNENRKNFFKAMIVFAIIGFVLSASLGVFLFSFIVDTALNPQIGM